MIRLSATSAVIRVLLAVFILAGASAPALAQRASLAGQVGVTFQSAKAPVFAGELGLGLLPAISIYGTVGRMQDVAPSEVADALDGLGDIVDANVRATYGIGGVRVALPTGILRPYGVAGVGMARLSANFEVFGFDLTNLIEDSIGFELDTNQFAYELGGGVLLSVAPNVFVDAGYRYMRIANSGNLDVSRAYAGLGLRF
jgi:hypothetical protein